MFGTETMKYFRAMFIPAERGNNNWKMFYSTKDQQIWELIMQSFVEGLDHDMFTYAWSGTLFTFKRPCS